MQFAYTARSGAGETLKGLLVADHVEQVRQMLRARNLFALTIQEAESSATNRSAFGRRGKVKQKDLLSVTSQLAIMTRTGIDLGSALQSVAEQCPNLTLRATLSEVHVDVSSGEAVSVALGKRSHVFGDAYVATIAAGETAGNLPEILQRLAHQIRSEIRHRGTIRQLLAYPVMLTTVSMLVVMGLVVFVLPQFAGIFSQSGMPLPFVTRVLLDVSMAINSHFWIFCGFVIVAVVGLVMLKTTAGGRRLWDCFLLHTAIIRDVARPLMMGRLLCTLGNLVECGVPVLEGMRLTRDSMKSPLFKEMLDAMEQDILNGLGLSNSLNEATFLPPGAAQMVVTGEQTGTLESVTQIMGEYYEEEGEAKLRELATILEPLIIVVMGVVVGTVVMAVMLPIFDMATLVN